MSVFDKFIGMAGYQKKTDEVMLAKAQLGIQEKAQLLDNAKYDDATYLMRAQQQDSLIRWQQDLNSELDNLKHLLRNEVFDTEQKVWHQKIIVVGYEKNVDGELVKVVRYMPPLLNEQGISVIETFLLPFMSKDTLNSNYDDEQIKRSIMHTCENLIVTLTINYKEYGLVSPYTDLRMITHVVKRFTQSSLLSALNDGWRRKIFASTKRIETESWGVNGVQQKVGKNMFA